MYEDLVEQLEDKSVVASCYQRTSDLLYLLGNPNLAPHIIIMDPAMPNITGFDLLEVLDEELEEVNNNVDVYLISSSSLKKFRERSLRFHSVVNFLDKPMLLEALRECVERRRNSMGAA